MEQYVFVRGYQENKKLRNSFNQLAEATFGINFEEWYQRGYWTDKYEPFSFIENNQVIANVSVNRVQLEINGERVRALQVGTVMTHPDYQGKGLSRRLMEKVIKEYENEVEMMYLFANHSVLEFYPRFGFKRQDEWQWQYILEDFDHNSHREVCFKKLLASDPHDLEFIYQFAKDRTAVGSGFCVSETAELLMFYCLYVFRNDIYYFEKENAIIICQQEGNELHIFDLLYKGKSVPNVKEMITHFSSPEIERVVYHFTPDLSQPSLETIEFNGSEVLFIRDQKKRELPEKFKHPLTSQA